VTIEHPHDFRTGVLTDVRIRRLSVLREDATPEFSDVIASWGTANLSAAEDGDVAARWSFVDADHDGHHDLRFETFEYAGPCAQADPTGWFVPGDPSGDPMCTAHVATVDHTYDASDDAFR
jgi:hypothetical protein